MNIDLLATGIPEKNSSTVIALTERPEDITGVGNTTQLMIGEDDRKEALRMKKVITADPEKCVACRTCELVCSLTKTGECNPRESRIRVVMFDEEGFYTPTLCFQCEEAWCARSCPAAAITRDDDTGIVFVNEDRCVGCRMCTMVCPFGQVFVSGRTGKSTKCDLCDGDPACVRFCPTGAIKFEKIDSLQQSRRKLLAKNLMKLTSMELKESKKLQGA